MTTSFIEREIAEQPDTLRRLITKGAETASQIASAIRDFDPTFVLIAARGTSDNAGRYAQYLMGIRAGLPVALAAPSIHTLYEATPRLSRALVIGISQSGQAEDVRRVLSDARAQGALTVSITNHADSSMAQTAAYHMPLLAGEEISVAATKTYTAQLTALALLTAALTGQEDGLADLPAHAAETLRLCEPIATWAAHYQALDRFIAIGRGYNYCTAFEISLKIKELCTVVGMEYSEADFRHGPMTLLRDGLPLIMVAPSGKTLPGMITLLEQAAERRAERFVISDDPAALALAERALPLPTGVPEWLTPIIAVIPGQIFAMHLALAKGNPVDKPRGLSKVTITL